MTPDPDPDPRYVAARRVLLDALDALAPHRPAVIVAGAQAVYLQGEPAAADVTREAIGYLDELFGHRTGAGIRMAVRALRLAISAQEVSTFATTYTRRMVAAATEGTPASTA